MADLQQFLEHIGLNHHESIIYLHLLHGGEQSASAIAQKARMPRSTTRNTLDKLCERNLVQKLYRRNTQFYYCLPPTSLVKFLEKQKSNAETHLQALQGLLPTLVALHEQKAAAPKVQFFEGKEQMIEAFNHSLFQEGVTEILFCTSYQFLEDSTARQNDEEFYIPLRVKKNISLRVLTGKLHGDNRTAAQDKAELRERRVVPEQYSLPGNFLIYGNFVAYFSAHENEYIAILVESSLMTQTMRSMFEFMWAQCQ